MNAPYFITTAIPYVNAAPHIGFAMELVLADVLARHQRLRGRDVRFLTGTDENSLKNVQAAEAEGLSTAALVERNAAAFEGLRETLNLSFDDFIRTSAQPRHRVGAEALWRACAARGDIYKRPYRGLYCVGCEQFYAEADLEDGRCPEHDTRPELVEEENWFFRLSRYEPQLREFLESGTLRVVPEQHRNEALTLVRGGLLDFSISRSSARARGWGVPVPGDPSQVMYVWFDALGNYITALGYGGNASLLERYWTHGVDRVHVLGKGITRFHAVYWPAILLSAGLTLPTAIAVHGYLTAEGRKIGKSLGNAIDPSAIVRSCGVDPVRYFLCRHIRAGRDGDSSLARVIQVRDTELADLLGNLLRRTTTMIERYCDGRVPSPSPDSPLAALSDHVRERAEAAFDALRPDEALDAVWSLVEAANRFVVERAPWKDTDLRTATLYDLAEVLRIVAVHLQPFTPETAREILQQLGDSGPTDWNTGTRWGALAAGTQVTPGGVLFPKS